MSETETIHASGLSDLLREILADRAESVESVERTVVYDDRSITERVVFRPASRGDAA